MVISLLFERLKNVAKEANKIKDGETELRKSGTFSKEIAIDMNIEEFFSDVLSSPSIKFKKNTMIKNERYILTKFTIKHLHR